jgi:Rps23 Pro-64 3,4-dihydroxylase Tpa1-like proline 4-hydroxylase
MTASALSLFALSPSLDRAAIRAALAARGRVQVRDVLRPEAAEALHAVLARSTRFGIAWCGEGNPQGQHIRPETLKTYSPAQREDLLGRAAAHARSGRFGFVYGQYPMVEAYKEQWSPGHPLDRLLEEINDPETIAFAREVSADPSIQRADAQATLYAHGHFLSAHDDWQQAEGRRLAYVLNLTREWSPDWGGYLNFLDEDGNVTEGLMPRFNSLALFRVPMQHHVSLVAPFAPARRYAITGWFRDR